MSFQYTYDAAGKPVGVFIPIVEWEQIAEELGKIKASGKKAKSPVLRNIEKGLKQVHQIKQGKLKAISLKQLFDELQG